jgi:hypothetical protein
VVVTDISVVTLKERSDYQDLKLIFKNSRGEERVIAEPQDKKEAVKEINKFLDDHNYKSYYMNVCEDDNGRLRIDVGSWSEFFYIEYMSLREWTK